MIKNLFIFFVGIVLLCFVGCILIFKEIIVIKEYVFFEVLVFECFVG